MSIVAPVGGKNCRMHCPRYSVPHVDLRVRIVGVRQEPFFIGRYAYELLVEGFDFYVVERMRGGLILGDESPTICAPGKHQPVSPTYDEEVPAGMDCPPALKAIVTDARRAVKFRDTGSTATVPHDKRSLLHQ